MHPDFSLIVPHFNTDSCQFARAIDSVVGQLVNGLSIELVAIDDGSDREPARKAADIVNNAGGEKGLTLRRVTHATNLGLAAARNSGISMATGKYVMFLDADDWLLPESLNALKKHLDAHPAQITYTLTALVRDTRISIPSRPAQSDLTISTAFNNLGTPTATLWELPQLALAMSSWSQVYDRNFLVRAGLEFDPVLRRWEDRPFVVSSHLAARSIAVFPRLIRAYFIGTKGDNLTSITGRKFDSTDLTMMYRHLRLVHQSLSLAREKVGPAYAAQHFWHSVQRYISVMGGAVLPGFFSNSKARRLCLGSGHWLWRQRPLCETGDKRLIAPLPNTLLGKIPSPLRILLIGALKYANTAPGALALVVIFALSALFRRVRAVFR